MKSTQNFALINKEIKNLKHLFNLKEFSKAEKITRDLIKKFPKYSILYNYLGLFLFQEKKINEAIRSFKKGIKNEPKFIQSYLSLANLYKNTKKKDLAIKWYYKAIKINPKNPEPYNNLGNLYRSENTFSSESSLKKAIKIYKKGIKIKNNPQEHLLYVNLGTAYKSLGKIKEAESYFKRSIKVKPNFFFAHRYLGLVKKWKKEDENLLHLKEAFLNFNNDSEVKRELAFTLGKAYDDIKNFDEAIKFFKEGNRIARSSYKYSINDEKDFHDKIKSNFDLFKHLGKNNTLISKAIKTKPIFIIGMPRSGTTLVEQILGSHSKVFAAGEITLLGDLINKFLYVYNENISNESKFVLNNKLIIKIKKLYIREVLKISKKTSIITNKYPLNFKWIGLIKLIFPESKVIHTIRNPKDICFSIYKNYFPSSGMKFSNSMDDILQFYDLYDDIMAYWHTVLPGFVYDFKYENLINKPKTEIEKLLNYLNLNWDNKCMNFYKNKRAVDTLSDTQVRMPLYNSSINYWKSYSKHLPEKFKSLKD